METYSRGVINHKKSVPYTKVSWKNLSSSTKKYKKKNRFVSWQKRNLENNKALTFLFLLNGNLNDVLWGRSTQMIINMFRENRIPSGKKKI